MFVDIVIGEETKKFNEVSSELGSKVIFISKNPGTGLCGSLKPNKRFISFSDEMNRKTFESAGYQIHYELGEIDAVSAKILASKDKIYALSFFDFLKGGQKSIKKMRTNCMLCKKYGVKIIVASFAREPMQLRSESELRAFSNLFLGLQAASKSTENLYDLLLAKSFYRQQLLEKP